MDVRPLLETDDRARFWSGQPELDRFFHRFAGQNQFRLHIGVTYVAVDAGQIVGYVTVAPGAISADALGVAARRRFPAYPIPVLRLARLAAAETARGKGVGKALLRHVLSLALRMSAELGCAGVLVDAKPDAIAWYRTFGFLDLQGVEGLPAARPEPTPMFLEIEQVRQLGN